MAQAFTLVWLFGVAAVFASLGSDITPKVPRTGIPDIDRMLLVRQCCFLAAVALIWPISLPICAAMPKGDDDE